LPTSTLPYLTLPYRSRQPEGQAAAGAPPAESPRQGREATPLFHSTSPRDGVTRLGRAGRQCGGRPLPPGPLNPRPQPLRPGRRPGHNKGRGTPTGSARFSQPVHVAITKSGGSARSFLRPGDSAPWRRCLFPRVQLLCQRWANAIQRPRHVGSMVFRGIYSGRHPPPGCRVRWTRTCPCQGLVRGTGKTA